MRWLRRRAEAPAPAPERPKMRPHRIGELHRETEEVLTDAARIRHRDAEAAVGLCVMPVVSWRVTWDEVLACFNVRHVFPGQPRDPSEDVEEFHQVGSRFHRGPLTGCYDGTCGEVATHLRSGRWKHHCGVPECPKYLVPEPAPSNVRTFPL